MSQIIVEKNTISMEKKVRVIQVPDCTSELAQVEVNKLAAQQLKQQATKTIEVLSDSIIEQILVYISELVQPILIWCNQHYEEASLLFSKYNGGSSIYHLKSWNNGVNLHFEMKEIRPNKYSFVMSTYGNKWKVIFHEDGKICQNDYYLEKMMSEDELEVIISRWSDATKPELLGWKDDFVERSQKLYDVNIRKSKRMIDTLQNFEL